MTIRDHSGGISPGRCVALATASDAPSPTAPASAPARAARLPRCAASAAPATAPIAAATPTCCARPGLSAATQRTYRPTGTSQCPSRSTGGISGAQPTEAFLHALRTAHG